MRLILSDSKHGIGDNPGTILISFSWILNHDSAITTDIIYEPNVLPYSLPAHADRLEIGPISPFKQGLISVTLPLQPGLSSLFSGYLPDKSKNPATFNYLFYYSIYKGKTTLIKNRDYRFSRSLINAQLMAKLNKLNSLKQLSPFTNIVN